MRVQGSKGPRLYDLASVTEVDGHKRAQPESWCTLLAVPLYVAACKPGQEIDVPIFKNPVSCTTVAAWELATLGVSGDAGVQVHL